tara:strand:- start:159 stop:710 length:552 start_codon:yes stop_codon:yes gene_type:complete
MDIPVFKKTTIDSTNEFAKRVLKQNSQLLATGFVVVAEYQTHGKGTKGRVWYSQSSGGLYYTLAIKPAQFDFSAIDYYHQAIAKAIQQVVYTLAHVTLTIRFPNDLFLAKKKVGGVLMESAMKTTSKATLDYLVIGIGLNINQSTFPPQLTDIATSLYLETNQTLDKERLIDPLTLALKTIFL